MTINFQRYSGVAKGLHWLIGLMILVSLGVGLYKVDLKLSPAKLQLYSWHKWAGVTIFALVLVRCLWRITHTPPPLPSDMPQWQRFIAETTHYILYGLMITIPLTGWLMSSAKGFQTVYFGVLPIPDLLGKNKELGETLNLVHKYLNYTMIAIISAHVGAALKHHFIDKDDILRRMLPARQK
ncbi:MAG: cytochrome b [Burkholderiales bacterium]|nr:cytochrome b [Burkholderiales bacterium]